MPSLRCPSWAVGWGRPGRGPRLLDPNRPAWPACTLQAPLPRHNTRRLPAACRRTACARSCAGRSPRFPSPAPRAAAAQRRRQRRRPARRRRPAPASRAAARRPASVAGSCGRGQADTGGKQAQGGCSAQGGERCLAGEASAGRRRRPTDSAPSQVGRAGSAPGAPPSYEAPASACRCGPTMSTHTHTHSRPPARQPAAPRPPPPGGPPALGGVHRQQLHGACAGLADHRRQRR